MGNQVLEFGLSELKIHYSIIWYHTKQKGKNFQIIKFHQETLESQIACRWPFPPGWRSTGTFCPQSQRSHLSKMRLSVGYSWGSWKLLLVHSLAKSRSLWISLLSRLYFFGSSFSCWVSSTSLLSTLNFKFLSLFS